jgi:hypothetical protein
MTGKPRVVRDPITVEGLAQFSRNLKKIDNDLPKALRVALNQGSGLVVDFAHRNMPARSGRARRSVKAISTRTEARVKGGGTRAPYYPWLDFGGRVGRGRTGKGTGSVHRRFVRDGRYIYGGYYKVKGSGELERVLTKALLDVVESAGIEVD